jgi:hypothetical protein
LPEGPLAVAAGAAPVCDRVDPVGNEDQPALVAERIGRPVGAAVLAGGREDRQIPVRVVHAALAVVRPVFGRNGHEIPRVLREVIGLGVDQVP